MFYGVLIRRVKVFLKNYGLYALFEDVDISKYTRLNRLKWAGHVIRKEISRKVIIVLPESKRKKGEK